MSAGIAKCGALWASVWFNYLETRTKIWLTACALLPTSQAPVDCSSIAKLSGLCVLSWHLCFITFHSRLLWQCSLVPKRTEIKSLECRGMESVLCCCSLQLWGSSADPPLHA